MGYAVSVPFSMMEITSQTMPSITVGSAGFVSNLVGTLNVPNFKHRPTLAYLDIEIGARQDTSAATNYLKDNCEIQFEDTGHTKHDCGDTDEGNYRTPASGFVYNVQTWRGFVNIAQYLTPGVAQDAYIYVKSLGSNLLLYDCVAKLRMYFDV
jgi:hypothetical protein